MLPDNIIPWPGTLPEQVSAVQSILAAAPSPLTPQDVARTFKGKRAATVLPVLEALAGIGMARRIVAGDTQRSRETQSVKLQELFPNLRGYNFEAALALLGLDSKPETIIALLLLSDEPIDREVRILLAHSIIEPTSFWKLKFQKKSKNNFFSKFFTQLEWITIGIDGYILSKNSNYTDAVENTAKNAGKSVKYVERAIALAHKFVAWIECLRVNHQEYSNLTMKELRFCFLYAEVTEQDPTSCIRSSASSMTELMDDWVETIIFGKERIPMRGIGSASQPISD